MCLALGLSWDACPARASGDAPQADAASARIVELNTASQAELERLRGIGVSLSERLLTARAEARFRDWADLLQRVPGLGRAGARRLSHQGLRVDGVAYE